ncbi:MAG TPA: fimbrial protein [Clostridium sp.]|nr:fimbrial protein [Clostridium sp.]
MNDINFFSVYQEKDKEKNDILKYMYATLIVFSAFVLISVGVNTIRIFMLNREINNYTEKLNDSTIQTELKEANKINSEIDILNKYTKKLGEISENIESRDNVSNNLLISINEKIPSEIYFKNIEVKSNEINIKGISSNNDSVAEFQHNLKQMNNMSDVFVESLDGNDSVKGEYSFQIKCILKDVD